MGVGILAIGVLVFIIMQTILRDNSKKTSRKSAKYSNNDSAGFIAASEPNLFQDYARPHEEERPVHDGSAYPGGHEPNAGYSHNSVDSSGSSDPVSDCGGSDSGGGAD
ncbi:hypothetical protein A8L34_15285 [Bacillus sp. FJAT-27264]|uniref:hypothetical protein n=1 Tax=Paenibacillus sp. (strain DSM 101736 / FJAT-27264) TaxID=1850362 RepID=UPI000807FCD0|nr:hypothetical protein [Bacillus sp. FJAT-27264]OBZ11705.1 hypothetical protein A8L34_15285 [Bacillus sp. FJAT-27264]